jgi:hypothetical protein
MPTAMFPMISVSVDREEIETFSFSQQIKVPDEKWRLLDKQGHGHFWAKGGKELPTLEWIVTGTEVYGDEYESYEVEVGEYRCKLCAEVIEPGHRMETPKPILGPTTVTLEVNGETFRLTEEEYAASVDSWLDALRSQRGL